MEYLAMFIGAAIILLLIGGVIYFFGSILRASLSNKAGESNPPMSSGNE